MITDRMKALFKATYNPGNPQAAFAAAQKFAKALNVPLRQGMMAGDITYGIFEEVPFEYGRSLEFPLDFLAPGTEKDFVAYTLPARGILPQQHVEGDYVSVPTYEYGNSIDWNLQYSRDARWDVASRALEVLEAGMVKKKNDDGWHTLLASASDRNIVVYDSQANSGQFTKRLLSLAKVIMRRNGGGNSASNNRGKLTDVFLSPELIEDMRNWGIDIVDEVTRREIFLADDNSDTVSRIFGVNLHDIDELGEGQEYQNFYTASLGASLATGDLELLVGLDLSKNDSFMNPVRMKPETYPRPSLEEVRRAGFFTLAEHGFCALDSRRSILLSA